MQSLRKSRSDTDPHSEHLQTLIKPSTVPTQVDVGDLVYRRANHKFKGAQLQIASYRVMKSEVPGHHHEHHTSYVQSGGLYAHTSKDKSPEDMNPPPLIPHELFTPADIATEATAEPQSVSLPLQKQSLVQHQPLMTLASAHVRVQQTFQHVSLDAQGDIDHQYSVYEFRSFWWTSNVFHKTTYCLHDSLCQCKAYVNVFYYVFLPVLQRSL